MHFKKYIDVSSLIYVNNEFFFLTSFLYLNFQGEVILLQSTIPHLSFIKADLAVDSTFQIMLLINKLEADLNGLHV